MVVLHELLSGASEEVLDDGDLQNSHSDHKEHLKNGEVVYSRLSRTHSGLVSVVPRLVVQQSVLELVQLSVDLVGGSLHAFHVLLWLLVAWSWHRSTELAQSIALMLDLKVHHLFSKCRHFIGETKLVLAHNISLKHERSLSQLGVAIDGSTARTLDFVVHVEITARLNCKVVAHLGTWFLGENVKTGLLLGRQVERQCGSCNDLDKCHKGNDAGQHWGKGGCRVGGFH